MESCQLEPSKLSSSSATMSTFHAPSCMNVKVPVILGDAFFMLRYTFKDMSRHTMMAETMQTIEGSSRMIQGTFSDCAQTRDRSITNIILILH